jgi:O-antigen/teichoic acid export membrane protein
MIFFNTNDFLITWLIGPDKVVEYQIYFKMFALPGIIVAIITTPIWSAVTKAQAENKYLWIKKMNKILFSLGVLGFGLEFVMILFLQFCIDIWLGSNSITVNYFYAVIFAISGGIFLWSNIISCLANGTGKLKIQIICFSIGAIINIPLAFILSRLINSYIAIVIANIISILPYCVIQPLWFSKYINDKVNNQQI